MNRPTPRTLFWTLLFALVVLLGVGHLATRRLSMEPVHSMIEKRLTEALTLDVTFDALRLTLLPIPHLEVEGVRIENLPERKSKELLRIERVDLGLAIWPLFDRMLEIDALSISGADLYIETDNLGKLRAVLPKGTKTPNDDEEGFRFDLRQLDIDRLHIVYHDRTQDTSHTLVFDTIVFESKHAQSEIALDAQGQFDGSDIVLTGEIGSLFDLLGQERSFPVALTGQIFEAHFDAKGVVRSPDTLEGLDLDISGEIPELVISGHPLPQLGSMHFEAQLSNLDGSLGLDTIRLSTIENGPSQIDVQGKIGNLIEMTEVDVKAHVDTGSLDFLTPFLASRADFPLSAFESLSAQAEISDSTGSLTLDGSARAATSGDALVIRAKGKSEDLKRLAGINIDLEARAEDIASITTLFPEVPQHGPLGAVTAQAVLKSHEHSLRADGIDIAMGDREKAWIEITGSINDVIDLHGVDLELSFGASGLQHLREVLAREFPETSAFEGAAGIHQKNGSLRLKHARLHGGAESPIEIHLDARFDEVPGPDEIEIDLGIRGADLSTLATIAGVHLPIARPVDFHGKIHGSAEHIDVEGLAFQLGDSHFSGSLSGSFPSGARPGFKARLVADEVWLQDFGLIRAEGQPVASSGHATREAPDPRAPLPFEALRHVDLDLDLRLSRVRGYQDFDGRDVRVALQLEDGLLELPEATARFEGGQLRASMRADTRTPVPTLGIGFGTLGLNLERLMSQVQEDTDFSGRVDAEIALEARGTTVDALRRSLEGSVGIAIRDGNAASKIAREFVVNLAAAVFRGFSRKKPDGIGCAVTHLEISQGIAHVRTLLLREKDVTVNATGQIDLVEGQYDLYVVPRTSNPGIIGIAPNVKVTGPLDAPRFKTVKRTLVTSFGKGLVQNTLDVGGTILIPFQSQNLSIKKQEERCRLAEVGVYPPTPQP